MTCRQSIARPLPQTALPTCPRCGKIAVSSTTMREELNTIACDTPGILDVVCCCAEENR